MGFIHVSRVDQNPVHAPRSTFGADNCCSASSAPNCTGSSLQKCLSVQMKRVRKTKVLWELDPPEPEEPEKPKEPEVPEEAEEEEEEEEQEQQQEASSSSAGPKPVPLLAESAKKRKAERAALRRLAKQAGQDLPKTLGPWSSSPPPPLCNRVAAPWGSPPQECSCAEWPKWLEQAPKVAVSPTNTVPTCMGNELIMKPDEKNLCSYWRPGGKNMTERFFYNGILSRAFDVRTSKGSPKTVAAVN